MSIIHCTLQGKGGVGKTFVSTVIAQYLLAAERDLMCIDADPVNATFAAYPAFDAQHVQLVDDGQFDANAFENMLRTMLEASGDVVVDNGATSFVPFYDHLIAGGALDIFKAAGKTLVIHNVIAGGEQLADTLNQFAQLAESLPEDTPLMVWLNAYGGPVERGGKTFEEMTVYQQHRRHVHGIIRLAKRKPLFETSIRLMREQNLTFDEAIASADFDVFHKQRLTMVQRELFAQLDPWMAALMAQEVPPL